MRQLVGFALVLAALMFTIVEIQISRIADRQQSQENYIRPIYDNVLTCIPGQIASSTNGLTVKCKILAEFR